MQLKNNPQRPTATCTRYQVTVYCRLDRATVEEPAADSIRVGVDSLLQGRVSVSRGRPDGKQQQQHVANGRLVKVPKPGAELRSRSCQQRQSAISHDRSAHSGPTKRPRQESRLRFELLRCAALHFAWENFLEAKSRWESWATDSGRSRSRSTSCRPLRSPLPLRRADFRVRPFFFGA